MRGLILALGLSLLAGTPAGAACAPASLTRIVTRDVTPGLPADHAARRPKTLYRLGDKQARMEEEADPARGVHPLTVISSPDVWMVNLANGAGRHAVDPGPTYAVHAPIFVGRTIPRLMSQLEYGCEAEFVRNHMTAQGDVASGDRIFKAHGLVENTFRLQVLLDAAGRPAEARLFQDERPVMVVAYDAYETGLPADAALFARPAGINFAETPTPR